MKKRAGEAWHLFRRIAVISAALIALAVPVHAESLCLVAPEAVALIDESGTVLLGGKTIENVFAVREGALYAAGARGEYRLYDADGDPIGETRFSMIDDEGDCLIFRSHGRFGAMDDAGNIAIPAIWTQLTSNGEGGFLALDGDPLDDRADEIIYIDAAGESLRSGVRTASGLARVLHGRMPCMSPDGLYGATDAKGQTVVSSVWLAMGPFEGGVAKVYGDEGAGLIDRDGDEILPPVCRWIERSASMLVAVCADEVTVYTPDGRKCLFRVEGEDLAAELVGDAVSVSCGAWTRLYAADGSVIAEAAPGTVFAPGAGDRFIAIDGAWGEPCQRLIGSGDDAPSAGFQRLLPLADGRYAYMEMPGTEYYSEDLGRIATSWSYEKARWGLVDASGAVIIPARYLEICALGDSRLLLRDENGASLANLDGEVICSWPPIETEAPSGGGVA